MFTSGSKTDIFRRNSQTTDLKPVFRFLYVKELVTNNIKNRDLQQTRDTDYPHRKIGWHRGSLARALTVPTLEGETLLYEYQYLLLLNTGVR